MSKSRFSEHECPVARGLDQIGDWWTLLVVREVMYGLSHFEDIRASLGISRAVLSDRLKRLVENDILAKRQDDEDGRAAVYQLTAKGADLWPVVLSLLNWSNRHIVGDDRQVVQIENAQNGVAVSELCARDESGQALRMHETVLRPGPKASAHMRGRLHRAFPPDSE